MSGYWRIPETVTHLDDSNLLFEVGVQAGDAPHIRVTFTDESGQTSFVPFDRAQAGAVSWILKTFDRRAVHEFGHLLYVAVEEVGELLGDVGMLGEAE